MVVHEPRLISKSKAIYDKYFLIEEMKPNEAGNILDTDNEYGSDGSAP